MPILGVIDSSKLKSTTAFDSIQTYTPSGTGALTFSSIPQTYQHLQLRVIARDTSSGGPFGMYLVLNSDTGTNYNSPFIYGASNSTTATGFQLNYLYAYFGLWGSGALANNFWASVTTFADYRNTNKNKSIGVFSAGDDNGNGTSYMSMNGGTWNNTAAITSLTVYPGSQWASGSSIALYGIKAGS